MLRDYLSHAIILLSSLLFQFPVCFLLPCPPHYFVARLPFSLLHDERSQAWRSMNQLIGWQY
uniref:Putative disease resistance protein At1g50180 isoform X2 n=1 Tax=Rhizophora mucronata TaxID=61149 RepID=A0A2P2JCJ9_RHIMU